MSKQGRIIVFLPEELIRPAFSRLLEPSTSMSTLLDIRDLEFGEIRANSMISVTSRSLSQLCCFSSLNRARVPDIKPMSSHMQIRWWTTKLSSVFVSVFFLLLLNWALKRLRSWGSCISQSILMRAYSLKKIMRHSGKGLQPSRGKKKICFI